MDCPWKVALAYSVVFEAFQGGFESLSMEGCIRSFSWAGLGELEEGTDVVRGADFADYHSVRGFAEAGFD